MLVPSPSDLSTQFATAYFDAAQAGAEMRNVANVLETLRGQLATATEPHGVWAALYDQIGIADLERFMPVLVKLADALESALISAHVDELRKAFAEDGEKGWTQWLDAYARSFGDAVWLSAYGAAIAQQALSYCPDPRWAVERIQKAAQAVVDERWPETYDWFLFLAERDLPAENRARFLAMVAEIQIFHFLQPTKARIYLEKSGALKPDLLLTRNAWGEYWTALGQWDKAREVFAEIIKAYPKRREGYVGMGDCDEKTGQLASAETWYYQAILNAPGQATGYRCLVSLWLRPDQPKEKADASKLQPLVRRWKALLERPATAPLSLGVSYKNRGQFEQARGYFDESIHSDPSLAIPHVWLGYTEMDEAAQNRAADAGSLYASARDEFDTAIRLAPGALDGYWGISGLYMQQQNWPAAEEWTNRCLPLGPEWESFVLVRRAELLRQQGRLGEAEADLSRSLAIEPANQAALDVMSSLVDSYRAEDKPAARRLLDEWKQRSDPGQAYLYYNRLANWSYEAGDYATAVDLYRQALQSKEADAVLHSNLAGALLKLRTTGKRREELREAIAEFERSNELAPQKEMTSRIADLRTEQTFLEYYGEAAAAFDPVADPIQVCIDWAVMPEILTGSSLTPETTAAVAAMRARLKDKFGFVLPGVNFRDLQPPGSGEYRVIFNESTGYVGQVTAGSVLSVILGRLEEVVQDHMAEFLGHDAVARMLKQLASPPAQAIAEDAARLTALVGFLRWMLARRQPIEPLAAIVEQFDRNAGGEKQPAAAVTADASKAAPSATGEGFPSLEIRIGATDPALLAALVSDSAKLQKAMFDELGVPVPPVNYVQDTGVAEHMAVLRLNGQVAFSIDSVGPETIRDAIRACAAQLLVPEVTNYFLAKIGDRYPVLIRAVRARFDLQAITAFLKQKLVKGVSIKDLPGTLENELQESLASQWTYEVKPELFLMEAGSAGQFPYVQPGITR